TSTTTVASRRAVGRARAGWSGRCMVEPLATVLDYAKGNSHKKQRRRGRSLASRAVVGKWHGSGGYGSAVDAPRGACAPLNRVGRRPAPWPAGLDSTRGRRSTAPPTRTPPP